MAHSFSTIKEGGASWEIHHELSQLINRFFSSPIDYIELQLHSIEKENSNRILYFEVRRRKDK